MLPLVGIIYSHPKWKTIISNKDKQGPNVQLSLELIYTNDYKFNEFCSRHMDSIVLVEMQFCLSSQLQHQSADIFLPSFKQVSVVFILGLLSGKYLGLL